jgi:hypothetical protein
VSFPGNDDDDVQRASLMGRRRTSSRALGS